MTKHGFELWLQKALKRISPVRYRLRYHNMMLVILKYVTTIIVLTLLKRSLQH